MTRFTFAALTTIALTSFACSKADKPTTPPDDSSATEGQGEHAGEHAHADGKHEHEHDFPTSVTGFHDTMAPLWHAEAGDARKTDTCAALEDLKTKASAIGEAEVPEKAADQAEAWSSASTELGAKLDALAATCDGTTEEFDAAFHDVHEAFHALVALVGHERDQ